MKSSARVLVLVGLVVLVVLAVPKAQPWNCGRAMTRATALAAVRAYYASCWHSHHIESDPYDADRGGPAQPGARALEFTVVHGARMDFVIVRKTTSGGWRVRSVGTGP